MAGTVDAIREWFRTYKIPDGKPENKFGLKGKCMDAAYAMKVIDETHHAWYERAVRADLLILVLEIRFFQKNSIQYLYVPHRIFNSFLFFCFFFIF